MYLNRAVEVGWMLLCVLPFLQVEPRAFGEQWASKWLLLDNGFRLQVKGLAELDKPIGEVFPRLIAAKFNFIPICID